MHPSNKQKWSKKSVHRGRSTVWVGFRRKNKKKEEWGRMVRKSTGGSGKSPKAAYALTACERAK